MRVREANIRLLMCPETVKSRVTEYAASLDELLGDDLLGVYLYGSVARGCYHPARSDVDTIVVLNNDSRQVEQMRAIVGGLDDPRVRLLELEHRAGFTRAINIGIGETTGELVFFANSDLFVTDDYIDEMVRFFQRQPRAASAIGKILRYELHGRGETDIIDTTGHTIGRNRRAVDRGENQRDTGRYEREEEVFSVSGAALVARREALDSIKVRGEYLDENFHMYKDDIDLCWRLRLAGWECWYLGMRYNAREWEVQSR